MVAKRLDMTTTFTFNSNDKQKGYIKQAFVSIEDEVIN